MKKRAGQNTYYVGHHNCSCVASQRIYSQQRKRNFVSTENSKQKTNERTNKTNTKQIYINAATYNPYISNSYPRIWQFLLILFFIVEKSFIIQFTL